MAQMGSSDEYKPTFYIGHHESDRTRVTPDLLRQAQDCNYDMLTTPITTPHFHTRVLTLLSSYLDEVESAISQYNAIPTVSSLSPVDTPLAPGETLSQLLGVISPWIDLCSPDPAVYNISRQVLELEVAYAAFCGLGNIILPAPKLHHGKLHGDGVTQYAYAIQEALKIGHYIHMSVLLPMMDTSEQEIDEVVGSLADRARGRYLGLPEDARHKDSIEVEERDKEVTVLATRKKPVKYNFFGTWDAWNIIRTVCKYNSRLCVALSIPSHLAPTSVQSRWHSEPLRLLVLTEKTFFENAKGYPAFTHTHQALLTQYMKIRNPPWLLLCDVGPIPGIDEPEAMLSPADGDLSPNRAADPPFPTPAEASRLRPNVSRESTKFAKDDPTPHLNYLRYLQRRQLAWTDLERFGVGYQDYLQAPLQPLTDNLESITYEVFEKDPIKYDQYLQAIQLALIDWRNEAKQASGPDGRIVVAVVGAGRGPLVTRALEASERTGIPIEIWAIEKNPNAFVLLQRHNQENWGNRVNLVKSDMRFWKGPFRQELQPASQPAGYSGQWPPCQNDEGDATAAGFDFSNTNPPTSAVAPELGPPTHYSVDILVSELLGSFADNELSPECLDGILPLLNRTHGLSIPCSYTAYLTPVSAPKLHADIAIRTANDSTAPDTPYVVMLHAIDYLSTTSRPSTTSPSDSIPTPVPNILEAWSFSHGPMKPLPATSTNKHNERHGKMSFNLRDRAVCHGLAGYFEAVLYPGAELSTNPLTMDEKSLGMMSWFPIYFPLKTPLYVPDASTLTVSIFRATDNRKVWYEWMVEAWSNLVGSSLLSTEKSRVRLGVSEVGSSKSGGCMM